MNATRMGQQFWGYSTRWLIGNSAHCCRVTNTRGGGRGLRWIFDDKSSDKGSSGVKDWTGKLSKSIEDSMQKASTRVVSTTRGMAQKTSKRIGSASEEAMKSAKTQAKKIIDQASQSSQDLARNASKSAMSASQQAMKASRDFVKSRTDQINKQVSAMDPVSASTKFVKSASDKAINSGKQALKSSSAYASSSTKEAAKKAASSAKSQIKNVSFSTQRVLRSALWWALAAIGVYGIATTLPLEMFRYVTRRDEKDTKEK